MVHDPAPVIVTERPHYLRTASGSLVFTGKSNIICQKNKILSRNLWSLWDP